MQSALQMRKSSRARDFIGSGHTLRRRMGVGVCDDSRTSAEKAEVEKWMRKRGLDGLCDVKDLERSKRTKAGTSVEESEGT